MNSKETWKLLESLETKDIQTLVFMSIRYLEKNRKVDFKEFMKSIKELRKQLERGV